MAPLRWGFIGTGLISNDFAAAVDSLPRTEQIIVAAAARDVKKAKEFAANFGIPKAFGSYEEIATCPEVDVVYVGTIATNHFELCKMVLEHGKHILCEKPLTLMLEHTEALVALAKQKKLFFLEAVWSRFFPSYKKLREEVASGTLGDINLITAQFGFKNRFDRLARKDLGGGSLVDIGKYTLQFALAVYGPKMPKTVKACGILNENGVDMSISAVLQYEDGRIAQLTTSLLAALPSEAVVYGDKGSLKLPHPFWCTTDVIINGKSESFPLPEVQKKLVYDNSQGLVYEAQEVRRCISEGLLESPFMTHEETVTIAKIEDEIKKQVGFSYANLYTK